MTNPAVPHKNQYVNDNRDNEHSTAKKAYLDRRRRTTAGLKPLKIVPAVISRVWPDEQVRDEIWFAPVCSACGELVTDLEDANVVTIGDDGSDPEFIGVIDRDATLSKLPGHGVVVHKRCDKTECVPWKPCDTIFRADQRYSFEKGTR